MKKLSDQEIISSVLKGNDEDFKYLIERYKDRAFSLLKRILRNDMDAEEALQDSFIKAFKSLKSFKGEAKFSSWFYRIVYNTAMTKISNRKTDLKIVDIEFDDNDEPINDLSNLYEENDTEFANLNSTEEFINKLLDMIPVKYSSVLTMFYIDELNIEEIAQSTGMTISNTKVILHRARNLLKSLAEKHNLINELY
ncbi:MAG TPA: sigma-70 family RNA polymerase sigma factor [Ignavibacteriales bacterium]|nr:sigma-70 family RNA polymerase sigma factor [Ignavibacteriales bacterium]